MKDKIECIVAALHKDYAAAIHSMSSCVHSSFYTKTVCRVYKL